MEDSKQTEKDKPIEENQKLSKSLFSEWLEQLQQESWQLELLISGFAIFGIYSARPFINELDISSSLYYSDELEVAISMAVGILKNGWFIFIVNLIVHVAFRGLWIGAIGLRYVSNDIEYDKLGYSNKFTTYLKNNVGSYDDYIERLERFCSVIFAYTFLLFLLFCSLSLFVGELMLLGYIIAKTFGETSIVANFSILFFLGFGILVFIDFISLGWLKKIKEKNISKVYFVIYRFFSIITLSFLYRPLLYNFVDNPYTKRLFYLSIPYIFFMLFSGDIFYNNSLPYVPADSTLREKGLIIDDNYYDDKRVLMLNEFPNEDRRINRKIIPDLTLESFEVKGEYSSLFILLKSEFQTLIMEDSTIIPYYKKGLSISVFSQHLYDDVELEELNKGKASDLFERYKKLRENKRKVRKGDTSQALKLEIDALEQEVDSLNELWTSRLNEHSDKKASQSLEAFLKYVTIKVDSTNVELDRCFYYRHPNFGEIGVKCFYPIDSLSTGFHNLYYEATTKRRDSERTKMIVLPFMKL